MWRHAGLERDAEGLRPLLDDPHPLARLVARSALFREESRGAHARADFPETDRALDHRHTVIAAGSDEPRPRALGLRLLFDASANRTLVRVLTRSQQSSRSKLNVIGYQCRAGSWGDPQ